MKKIPPTLGSHPPFLLGDFFTKEASLQRRLHLALVLHLFLPFLVGASGGLAEDICTLVVTIFLLLS